MDAAGMANTTAQVLYLALAVFNCGTIALLIAALKGGAARTALREPLPSDITAAELKAAKPDDDRTSSSRVIGVIGGIVLATFFWAVGNAVLLKMFLAPTEVGKLLEGIPSFMASGAALFAPYAVNQLKGAIKS